MSLRCPFCHSAVEEPWLACSACFARHHASCWEEHGACGSCGARSPLRAPAPLRRALAFVAVAALAGAVGFAAGRPGKPPTGVAGSALERAHRLYERGDLDSAIEELSLAIARDSRCGRAWALRGSLRLERGDVPGALTDLERACELAPGDRWARSERDRARAALHGR